VAPDLCYWLNTDTVIGHILQSLSRDAVAVIENPVVVSQSLHTEHLQVDMIETGQNDPTWHRGRGFVCVCVCVCVL